MRTVGKMCLLAGIPVSAGLFCCTAALMTAADFPPGAEPAAAMLPLLAGCFVSGEAAARRLRRRALQTGALSALLLTGIWYAAACIILHRLPLPFALLLTVPAGMLGGMTGAARNAPRIRRRTHLVSFLRPRIRLFGAMLHQPKKTNPAENLPENSPENTPLRKL